MASLRSFLPAVRWQRWALGTLATFMLLAVVFAHFLDEPLRRRVEAGVNASLKGYKVTIGRLDFHPFGFSLDLEDSVVIQEANPDPPMAEVPLLTASVQWRSLLMLRLVADFKIVEPKLRLDRENAEKEVKDKTPVQERGWQQAAQEIYPLKINEVRIVDGDITFQPEGQFKVLHLSDVDLRAANIRNIRSREREYPSELEVDAVVFDNGRLHIDGNADFLAEPYAGIKTRIEIDKAPLDYLTGVIHDYATIRKGTLSGKGELEYAPKIQRVDLLEVSVVGADADYQLTNANEAQTEKMRVKTIQEAREVSNAPDVQLRAEKVRITDSTLGWIDRTGDPDYRVYIGGLDLTVSNFSNQKKEGAGIVEASGKLNGSGPAKLRAVFRPQTKSPDFDLSVGIDDTQLKTLNDLLRAKAGIDVSAGVLSYFSELTVRNNAIDGYVKVLFHDIDVYDKAQDKEKPFFSKAKEALAEGVANVLENRSTDEVATRASIKGPLENPNADIWEIIGKLIQNAFFQAILPGLDSNVADIRGIWSEENRKAAREELEASGKARKDDEDAQGTRRDDEGRAVETDRDGDDERKRADEPKRGSGRDSIADRLRERREADKTRDERKDARTPSERARD